jgi:hypothetical protein
MVGWLVGWWVAGVSLLPFVDKARLHAALAKASRPSHPPWPLARDGSRFTGFVSRQVYGTLTEEERERNTFGVDLLFVRSTHALAEHAAALTAGSPLLLVAAAAGLPIMYSASSKHRCAACLTQGGQDKQRAAIRLQALPSGEGPGLPMDGDVCLPPASVSEEFCNPHFRLMPTALSAAERGPWRYRQGGRSARCDVNLPCVGPQCGVLGPQPRRVKAKFQGGAPYRHVYESG